MLAVSFLVQTLGSIGIAVAVLVVGFVLNLSAEHGRWLRQTRLQLYSDFLEQTRLFDRRATRMATWWRPSDHADERIAAMQEHQALIGELNERIRIVGSKERASESAVVVAAVLRMVVVDEDEHVAMAFVDADPRLADYLEDFAAGARAELKADGVVHASWRRARGKTVAGELER